MNNTEQLLYEALSPDIAPGNETQETLLQLGKEYPMNQNKNKSHKRAAAAAAIAAIVIAGSSVSAYAAWHYLSAGDVAEQFADEQLAEAFRSQQEACIVAETQSIAGYDVSLLGVVSGAYLSDYVIPSGDENGFGDDRTYIAVAISKSDGSPMPANGDPDFDPTAIFVSPYIKGLAPQDYNAYTLNGSFTCSTFGGVQYRILDTACIEPFADRGIYIGVSEGMAWNSKAYHYDEATGELSRSEDFSGLNALFTLDIDPALADPAEADAILQRIDAELNGDS